MVGMSIAPETGEHPVVPFTEGAEQELAFGQFQRDLRELCGRMEDDFASSEPDDCDNRSLICAHWRRLQEILDDFEEEIGL